jgi:hypothetical protein
LKLNNSILTFEAILQKVLFKSKIDEIESKLRLLKFKNCLESVELHDLTLKKIDKIKIKFKKDLKNKHHDDRSIINYFMKFEPTFSFLNYNKSLKKTKPQILKFKHSRHIDPFTKPTKPIIIQITSFQCGNQKKERKKSPPHFTHPSRTKFYAKIAPKITRSNTLPLFPFIAL